MFGRDSELSRLTEAMGPGEDSANVIFLDGAIGVGKTSLLTAAIASLTEQRVVFARASQKSTDLPFSGVRSIIESLLDVDLPDLLAEGLSMRTLYRRVSAAIAETPTLLAVDDAHWLDPDSRKLLAEILSTPLAGSVTLLFAHRSSQVPEPLPLAATRGGRRVLRITLEPLEDAAARSMLSSLGSTDDAILQLAAGNPLFLRLLAEGQQSPRLEDLSGIASLDDTLRTEIAALPDSARALLHVLALSPAPPPAAIAEISGLREEDVAAAADRLSLQGLADPGQLEILHPLIQAAAYRDMTATVRRRMHRLAASHMPGLLDCAAHLRHLGAHLTEDEIATLMEAATTMLASAPRGALVLLKSTERHPNRSRDLLLAKALLLDGRPAEAEALLRTLISTGDPTREATGLLIQSLRFQGRPDEAIELLREVSDSEEHPETAVEAATLFIMHNGELDPAQLRASVRAFERPGVAASLSGLTALAYLRQGDVVQATPLYEAARDGFASMPASEMLPVLDAVTAAGWSAHMLGDFPGGISFVKRAVAVAEQHGQFYALPHLYCILAFLYVPLNELDEATELAEQAIEASKRYNWPEVAPLATTAGLVAAASRVEVEEWYQRLIQLELPRTWWWRQIVELFTTRAEIRLEIPTDLSKIRVEGADIFGVLKHIGLGEYALKQQDSAGAERELKAALALSEQFGSLYYAVKATAFQIASLYAAGRMEEAKAAKDEAIRRYFSDDELPFAKGVRSWICSFTGMAEHVDAAVVNIESLTKRESGIADLVADGRSNRDIAAHLHLSVRTVESHVASILRKRGLRSRAGLARLLDS